MKILAAMSGGVDSSVTAGLLMREGHQVIGATMSLYEAQGNAALKTCCGMKEAFAAKVVCDRLGIDHVTFDMKDDFKKYVVDNFSAEYEKGRTPNPCVRCNQYMKFELLYEKALALGCSHIATGHYAKLESVDGEVRLIKGDDDLKDQSYFLYPIPLRVLPQVIFPLGHLVKAQVREIAREMKLPTADKTESQDVCFISGKTAEFLSNQIENRPGNIVDTQGKILGTHQGTWRYTVGQRRGLAVAAGYPVYVKEIIPETATIVAAEDKELFSKTFTVSDVNVLAPKLWHSGGVYEVKVRYRTKAKDCRIYFEKDGIRTELEAEERGITRGQSAVFYQNGAVAAGGIIQST